MDWPRLIKELQARGLSLSQIAERTGFKASSSIHDLLSGKSKEPGYSNGESIRKLHEEMCGARRNGRRSCRDDHAPAVMAPSLIGNSGDANDRTPKVER